MKRLLALLAVPSLVGCVRAVEVPLRPVYHATPKDGELTCCILIDELHEPDKPLEQGNSLVGEFPVWGEKNGALSLSLRAGPIGPTDNPSMGIFSLGHNYGPSSIFLVRATFQRPFREPDLDRGWSVGVAARTGGRPDYYNERRMGVTLRFLGAAGQLRYRENDNTAKSVDLRQDVIDDILNESRPFTLELWVDRTLGKGSVTFTSQGYSRWIPFEMEQFKSDDGDPTTNDGEAITVVGATLAICCNPGKWASVEITDFQIWEPGSRLLDELGRR